MTATRILRGATIAAAVGVWVGLAALLWRTTVPDGLRLPHLDESAVFGRRLVHDAARYERLLDFLWLGATLTNLVVLGVLVRRGRRLAQGLGLGRVNAGIVVGVVSLTILWAAELPWAVASKWWQRRYGISRENYADALFSAWGSLLATTFVAFVALAVILGYARALRRRWWLAAVPTIVALGVALQFVVPYLVTLGTDPLPRGELTAEIRQLEESEDAGNPPIRVETVSETTSAANAYSLGIGPSERVIFWDTLLHEFSPNEVRFVAAHELAHLTRNHILKGLAWIGLFTLPILGLVAFVTERGGGLREPANVPLGLLVLVAANLVALPLRNEISRRYETEADWIALGATRDPGAARGLFRGFSAESLQNPTPPGWVHVFLEDHPTVLQRIELARAWAKRNR